jgi:hypothetical protein
MVRHGIAGLVDHIDVERGAGLDNHGPAVQERLSACDIEIW